ncbi:MAG: protein ligase [Pseudomonadota bacterium]
MARGPAMANGMTAPMIEIETLDAGDALAREMALLQSVSAAPDERHLWVWQSPRALVAPRKLAAAQGFSEAAARMAAAGWPVHLRATGGDVTPQGPGIVNITHVYSIDRTRAFSIEAAYDRLCTPIETALGPGAARGWMPGAFCDGAHNVQFNGKKFAGTAMRFRPATGDRSRMAVMAHALMLFAPPSQAAIDALNAFLGALGASRRIERSAHIGLPDDAAAFLKRLRSAFGDPTKG